MNNWRGAWLAAALVLLSSAAGAVTVEFNSTGGSTATNGLHFYIEDTTHIQVRRLNNTGQVYSPTATPPSTNLDNGVFIRANGKIYGPSHNVTTFTPSGGMYNTYSIGAVSPANPSSSGVQQSATANFGITAGPQVSIVWKYTTPLDFLTAEVTLTIPTGYAVSAANPVRYYHVFDNYLGGSDNGCGVSFVDSNGKRVIGTYPPASGNTCPSSTAIPNGVSVVESFRERSGLNFSYYCTSYWSDFFVNGGSNCSVLQSAVMSNTVSTAYQDTGLGIEFDFTAAGTYTFSYDFVVGSPIVPPYDHLEIQHDGAATLCPDNVTVLACTASTVPCPTSNLVNTGTLTGSVTVSPTTPTVTITPTTFTLGATATTATVALQGSGAGSYTLGVSNPSTVPLNGVKCYNTATLAQSCTFAISNTACVANFECIETGLTYTKQPSATRNPLYTKLAGTGFKFDVVALKADGTLATTYTATSNLKVELFDDNASPQPACTAYASPIATQQMTFASTDNGRKTLPNAITVANAYPKVRCRVTDSNMTPNVVGCSSDDFAIRPTSLSISSDMTADLTNGSNTSATPKRKAGANFQLTATGVAGYIGTPVIDNAKIQAHTGAVAAGTIAGNFPAASAATGTATGNTFTYSEVGYFRFQVDGVSDPTFTAVDQPNDCINVAPDDYSNVLVGGKYGCKFGNTATTNYFGRFFPDHFTTTPTAQCGGFAYSGRPGTPATPGQPFTVAVTANNAAGGTTANYAGSFARSVDLTSTPAVGSLYVGSTAGGAGAIPAASFSGGVGTVTNTAAAGKISYVFAAFPYALTTVTLHGEDSETTPSVGVDGSLSIRAGRLRLSNVYGFQSPLRMPVEAQYWSGNSWVRNNDDGCTPVVTANTVSGGWPAEIRQADPPYSLTTKLVAGKAIVSLAPTGPGSVTVCADLSADPASGVVCSATSAALPWLQSKWPTGANYDNDPAATATFGVFSPEGTRGIYNREMY